MIFLIEEYEEGGKNNTGVYQISGDNKTWRVLDKRAERNFIKENG